MLQEALINADPPFPFDNRGHTVGRIFLMNFSLSDFLINIFCLEHHKNHQIRAQK
jgi:hypothetical protein